MDKEVYEAMTTQEKFKAINVAIDAAMKKKDILMLTKWYWRAIHLPFEQAPAETIVRIKYAKKELKEQLLIK